MKKVNLQFEEIVCYNIDIEVTDEEYELIKNLDCEDVLEYTAETGKFICNPQYDFLTNYATSDNISDCADYYKDVIVTEIEE
jgi:hypothetical protein